MINWVRHNLSIRYADRSHALPNIRRYYYARPHRHPNARRDAVLPVSVVHGECHAQLGQAASISMTQDELWLAKWQEAIDFLETNHRKPSKFIPEERNMRSWWKHNNKLMNAGGVKAERLEMFKQLLELGERYKHVNQYQ